jgi:tetratricopeptide (TPR) repeat protein
MTDTQGARDDMRIARQYIDRSYELKEQEHGYFTNLDYAMKYIEKARQKDPNVTLAAKANQGGVFEWKLHQLEGEIFCIKGVYLSNSDSQKELSKAISLLQHSLKLFPLPRAYEALIRSYIATARRSDALALFKDAKRDYPDDMRIQKLFDDMEHSPTWGNKIYRSEHQIASDAAKTKLLILRGVCFALFLYSFLSVLTLNHPPSGFEILMDMLGIVGFFVLIATFFL